MPKVVIIDHLDSFTHNIAQLIEEQGSQIDILPYSSNWPSKVENYNHVVLSPGPGTVDDYPKTLKFIKECPDHLKILGICLGMQAIASVFNCKLFRQAEVQHGRRVEIIKSDNIGNASIFSSCSDKFEAALYHSWAVEYSSVEQPLIITALSSEGVVMGLKHEGKMVEGVQFHPESFLCKEGHLLFQNWLQD